MAVEIKEVIIRAVLEDDDDRANASESGQNGNSGSGESVNPEELIEMCVEQVLRILQRKNYR
jgi:hypothetical protein